MGRRSRAHSFLALAAFLVAAAAASPTAAANPQISALVGGVDDDKARRDSLRIEAMDVVVRLHGGIAETIVTARFRNPGEERLEARFALQMPDGSIVTGYALDIGDVMVEGVLLDQIEARRAYEAQVRKDIDPGLGEVSRGFQFTTRVYPVDAGASRTVRVRFVTPLKPGQGYFLPFDAEQEIGRFNLDLSASGTAALPEVRLPGGGKADWVRDGAAARLAWRAQKVRLEGALAIAPAAPAAGIAVGAGPAGESYFEIADAAVGDGGEAPRPRRVAVLWDRSLSRADDRLADEIALLRAWLEAVRPESVELILFDASGVERAALRDAAAVAARLGRVTYRGATSLGTLAGADIGADACLLFTDGLVTIDRAAAFAPSCPLTAISSAPDADRSALGALAAATGGEALHLAGGDRGALLTRMTRRLPRVVRVRSTTGAPIEAVLLDAPAGGWRLVGPMPRGGGVVVGLSGLAAGTAERIYSPPAAAAPWSGAAALWAADRLAVRAAAGRDSREALLAFARLHSVAGPDISFLVLESAEDYARARIEPPAGLPAAQRARYAELIAEDDKERAKERAGRLERVLAAWEGQKKWWNTPFDPNAKADPDEIAGREEEALPPPPPPPPPAPSSAPQREPAPGMVAPEEQDLIVTGDRIVRPNSETGDSLNELPVLTATRGSQEVHVSEVAPAEWASTRPYMKLLRAAAPAERERVFTEQQAKHGGLPAFWFDVAELAWRQGRRDEAKRLLLSALDLPTRNTETLAIVAERLFRYGETDRAIELYEAVAAAEPDRPQPLRSLALALGKRAEQASGDQARADLARAIDLYARIVATPWDDDFEGIELIALMEVNRLIPRYRALGGVALPLDPRLIALLDVDLRIVIEWNTEETDLDLWVDEPNRERAFYGNAETRIGGRMSEDMTEGYGPEEYLLRRAPPGMFTVRADVYSADELNPNGASRITARLIRNFGRPDEKEEIVEIELLPESSDDDEDDDDEVRLIGKVRIRR